MIIDYHGVRNEYSSIFPLVDYLEKSDPFQKWEYMGLIVEIDPTADYKFMNVLVRWIDYEEGFNDRIIVILLEEFNSIFKEIHDN